MSLFGLFDLPDLIARNDYLFRAFIEIHKWLGYGLIACIVIHAAAALRHHILFKDETLRKMWPQARS